MFNRIRRQALIWSVVSGSAHAAVLLPIVPGDSARGEKLFVAERCVQCHSVAGTGGKTAPDLGKQVDAAHAVPAGEHDVESRPGYVGCDGRRRNRKAQAERGDAADLFAFFYSTRF